MKRRYTVWTLDVLGNATDGYEVNDRSCCGVVEFDPQSPDADILMELYKAEFLSAKGLACAVVSDQSEVDYLYIDDGEDGRPLYQLEIKE